MIRFDHAQTDWPTVRLGLIALQSDERIEHDFRRLLPAHAALHVSRVPSAAVVSTDSLAAMAAHLADAAALFPQVARFDAVGYGCTSGASVIGPGRVASEVRKGTQTAAVTEPVSAILAAAQTLGLNRLALLSPYVPAVSDRLRAVLAQSGIDTPVFGSFEVAEEAMVVRIAAASIQEAATSLAASDAVDGILISCTNLDTLDVIDGVEAASGKPVLTSNQALIWHMCRLAGLGGSTAGFGCLWRDHA